MGSIGINPRGGLLSKTLILGVLPTKPLQPDKPGILLDTAFGLDPPDPSDLMGGGLDLQDRLFLFGVGHGVPSRVHYPMPSKNFPKKVAP